MHYKICNIKPNIKTTDIHLKTQIYLDESQQFEYWKFFQNHMHVAAEKYCLEMLEDFAQFRSKKLP